jgi:hypothetical protein
MSNWQRLGRRNLMKQRFIGLAVLVIVLITTFFQVGFSHAQPRGVNLKQLPLGDGKLSDSPRVGWIWACRVEPDAGGALVMGPWIKADGTYDFTAKAVVDGQVNWPQRRFHISRQGDRRIFSTNDLPNHPTGVYPVSPSDDAFRYDPNPNRIAAQNIQVELPANPQLAAQPSCTPGAVGILETGVVLFNALDAPGRDAVAHETQDACQGHPQPSGIYHYHSATTCLPDKTIANGHSTLVGYSLDGFGIFGRRGQGGKVLTSADLDACHGHTHAIPWDGQSVSMYHYHATWDFPYTVGCMRGTYRRQDVMKLIGPPPDRPNQPGAPRPGMPN